MLRIVLGISGATGIIYGVRMLQVLSGLGVEVHLLITDAGIKNLLLETEYTVDSLAAYAAKVYDVKDLAAPIASGSYKTDGMLVAPCSMKTLSALANSYNDNLLVRAADVALKERRKLVLLVRETPLHEGHLELMMKVTHMGGIIMPPVPAFYHMPRTIEDIVDHTVGKALDLFGLDWQMFKRWGAKDETPGSPGVAQTG